jgi:hypothetical protein
MTLEAAHPIRIPKSMAIRYVRPARRVCVRVSEGGSRAGGGLWEHRPYGQDGGDDTVKTVVMKGLADRLPAYTKDRGPSTILVKEVLLLLSPDPSWVS